MAANEEQRAAGRVATDRLKGRMAIQAKASGQTLEQVLETRTRVVPAEFGELCAYVCSAQAAFITGQKFPIDGGTFPGAC